MQPWVIYALLAATSAALVGIFSKVGIRGIDSTVATALRGLTITLSMGLAAFMLGKWETLSGTSMRSIVFIILAGLFGGLSWLWGFLALQNGGEVTIVNAIDKLSIVLVFIFAIAFLHDEFTMQKFLGVILVGTGIILLTMSREQLVTLLPGFIR